MSLKPQKPLPKQQVQVDLEKAEKLIEKNVPISIINESELTNLLTKT